jgi:hypothetical protein
MKSRAVFSAAALLLAFSLLPRPAAAEDNPAEAAKAVAIANGDAAATAITSEPIHPFATMAGSWSGGGTISLSGGTRERLRCRANHSYGKAGKSLAMSIRCASDSYKFDLVDRRGRIFGRWSEAGNGVSGSISGRAAGNRISAVAKSDMFTAGISVATSGNRQSVSITLQGVYITGVHIALTRR